jgi:hypothetical protein
MYKLLSLYLIFRRYYFANIALVFGRIYLENLAFVFEPGFCVIYLKLKARNTSVMSFTPKVSPAVFNRGHVQTPRP